MKNFKTLAAVLCVMLMTLIIVSSAFAMNEEYNYMSPASLQKAVESKADIDIVDIQEADGFKAHHITGAIKTCAYPVKSSSDKAKFKSALKNIKNASTPVVVICPRGKGGAERTVEYFVEQGVAPYRMFILTEGQSGWPYAVEKN